MRWWQRKNREADLDQELLDHIELEAETQRATGKSKDDSWLAARRSLGNKTLIREDVREEWG